MTRHLHLDLVGGLSGDMFISGMLDAFPEHADGLEAIIEQAGFPDLVELTCTPHDDGTLTGTRFKVSAVDAHDHHDHDHHHGHGHHHHRHYSEIRDTLSKSGLAPATREAALEMFHRLAVVEAGIHGKQVDEVAFHEVGAWDSIADIVLAAHLISVTGATSWSVSAIPAGRGFVETAHGRLPVPAPATARLLEGFELVDDGIEGERVTPTGATILNYLAPVRQLPGGYGLAKTGYGFGTKTFPGLSNTVRVCVYESASTGQTVEQPWQTDEVMRLSFELDDQTPEAIAQSIEKIRQQPGVLDVSQQAFFGKKNRQGFSLSVLVQPDQADTVTTACFALTTTLGVRREIISRATLPREEIVVYVGERAYRVKVARRPNTGTGGFFHTAKIEMDDLLDADLSPAEQAVVRSQAEALALEQYEQTREK